MTVRGTDPAPVTIDIVELMFDEWYWCVGQAKAGGPFGTAPDAIAGAVAEVTEGGMNPEVAIFVYGSERWHSTPAAVRSVISAKARRQ